MQTKNTTPKLLLRLLLQWKSMISMLTIGMLALAAISKPVYASETIDQMSYRGGPILESLTVYPLFYGNWQKVDMDAQQKYLLALAAYISGQTAPPGQKPLTWQYGVRSVSIAPYQFSNQPALPPHSLNEDEIVSLIHYNQRPIWKTVCGPPPRPTLPPVCHQQLVAPAKLPQYSAKIVILIFPSLEYPLNCGCGGYHDSESRTAFYGAVQPFSKPDNPAILDLAKMSEKASHEIFEAATDPAGNRWTNGRWMSVEADAGWKGTTGEVGDGCDGIDVPSVGRVSKAHDNTQNGICSTSDYINWANWTAATRSSGRVSVPDDSVVGGQDIDGNALYVCRSGIGWSTRYGQTPGKYQVNFNGCHFAFGGSEKEALEFEFLVTSWSPLKDGRIPPNAVQAGTMQPPLGFTGITPNVGTGETGPSLLGFPGIPLYVCRSRSTETGNSLTPGYIGSGTGGCKVSYGGAAVTLTDYEVLVRVPESPLPLSTVHVSDGTVPLNALRGGKDSDGTPLYLCSAKNGGAKFPGKLRADFASCLIAVSGQEVWVSNVYDVLVPNWSPFLPTSPSQVDFPTGRDITGLRPLYSCRSSALGGTQPGSFSYQLNMIGYSCAVGFAGNGYLLGTPFDVLGNK